MNDTLTNTRLLPERAIIVYRQKSDWSHEVDYYLESRHIVNQDGKYLLMAPVPLSDGVMKSIAGSYVKKNSLEMAFEPIVSGHMLHGANKPGSTSVIWYRPEMVRSLNFSSHLGIKGSSSVKIPATLYMIVNTKLYLFALADSSRPDQHTKLFNAPFFNIYEDGNVCLGTAHVGKIRAKTFDMEADRFERAFFMAEQNGGEIKGKTKTPLKELWNQLIKKKQPFPSKKELIPHAKFKTLGELMSKLIVTNLDVDDN